MALPQPAHDVPLLIISANASSERRVSPAWTLAHFKARLVPVTGIPASAQQLGLRVGSQDGAVLLQARDEESTLLSAFPLQPFAELHVTDTRPPAARVDFTDVSAVQKYIMPESEYETRKDSVLAWKKAQKLGRFDPASPALEEQKIRALEREIEERGIRPESRAQLLPPTDARRGTVRYVGPVPEIPGPAGAPWVGIELDEPTGKNDGSVSGAGQAKRYFQCRDKHGVFVRPERVEVGDFAVLDELGAEGELEEM